jgi:thiamine transport system substrate-binding protein
LKKLIAMAALAALTLTGCSATENTLVRIATHDSFAISDELIAEFESETGYQLEVLRLGDTGSLTNQLVLTKNAPVADAFYGIDNTFLSIAIENQIVDGEMTEINYSDVCFNYDIAWFEDKDIQPPVSWRDLALEQYRSLTVTTNPNLSSPGLAFLATTIAGFDSQAETFEYWQSLKANDLKVAGSWEDAYFVDFTRYGGTRPIVLSYASSPAAEVGEDGTAGTKALLIECFRQFEYAGVLEGAANPPGAAALIEFLRSPSFQTSVPDAMYVYPSLEDTELPEAWASFAKPAESVIGQNLDFAQDRSEWLAQWSAIFDN